MMISQDKANDIINDSNVAHLYTMSDDFTFYEISSVSILFRTIHLRN